MKYLSALLLLLVITFNLSAQSTQRLIELSGSIAGKYPIKMTLTIRDNKVLGYYFYEKHKTKILLEGDLKEGKMTLRESPGYEPEFSVGFIGTFKDSVFFGAWKDQSKRDTRTLNFKVTTITDQSVGISKLDGYYGNVRNSDAYQGEVSLTHISNNWFAFEISNGTETGCMGYIHALVYLPDLTSGVYSGSSCEEIKFSLASGTLTLEEKNCELHGMRCPFTGTYKKGKK